jgi:hypothetical protein
MAASNCACSTRIAMNMASNRSVSRRRPVRDRPAATGQAPQRHRDPHVPAPPAPCDTHQLANTQILIRADSHYCCPEVIDFCRANGLDFILGVAPTTTLCRHIEELEVTKARFEAGAKMAKLRRFKEFFDGAVSWSRVERIIAWVEAGEQGTDTRFIVINLAVGRPKTLYEDLYCRRGTAENHIKSWKTHLAADRTSCSKATANAAQLRIARDIAPVVCVQNHYNLVHRDDDAMIDALAEDGIAYVPYFPLGGFTPVQTEELSQVADEMGQSPQSVALAWLLNRSPNILLIPGTSRRAHLRANVAAAGLPLSEEHRGRLNSIANMR